MKRITVVMLLLLVFVLISGGGSNAFANNHSSPPLAAVANLVCSLSAATPPTFDVISYSSSASVPSTVVVNVGTEGCAQALADLLNAGLQIKDVKTVSTNVVYTLVSGWEM